MSNVWKEPTAEQHDQCALVANEIVETVNRAIREGIDSRVVLAGIGSALTDTITAIFGPTAVVPWFEGQARLLADMQRGH